MADEREDEASQILRNALSGNRVSFSKVSCSTADDAVAVNIEFDRGKSFNQVFSLPPGQRLTQVFADQIVLAALDELGSRFSRDGQNG